VDLGNSMGEEPGRTMSQLQTSWTPRNPYQSGGHDPETNEHNSKLMGDRLVSPSCCTDNSFSLVLLVNSESTNCAIYRMKGSISRIPLLISERAVRKFMTAPETEYTL